MMFGRTPVLQFDLQEEIISLEQDSEHVKKLNTYLSSMTEQARENIQKNQAKYKSRYDQHRSNPSCNINDLVLVKTLNNRGKFDIRHEGPFEIIEQLGDKIYMVQHIKKQTLVRQITVDSIIPIFERKTIN